jgi:hypothetical protein
MKRPGELHDVLKPLLKRAGKSRLEEPVHLGAEARHEL